MEPGYRLRLYLLTALVLVGFGVLLTRLHEFQIERRNEFLDQVPGNRTVTVREPGIRGEITDRNGITLAKNLRNYEVSFNLDEIRDAYVSQHENEPKIKRIVTEDGMSRGKEEKDIVSIVQDGKESTIGRLKTLGLAKNYSAKALRAHYLTHGGLIPFSYRTDLDYNGFAKIAEYNLSLPGVYVGIVPQRQYPYGALASHVLGYIKPWEKRDIPESAARAYNHYVGDDKGADGVEATMDEYLLGPEGRKTVVKDEKGRTIRMSDYAPPGTGAKVKLTIDAPVQYLLENTLRLAGRAAGVVMDVNTGEVLAMASVPDYNPNDFIPSISKKNWDGYRSNKVLSPLLNRAIAAYTPGSTMKVPVAISAALAGRANSRYSCNGFVTYGTQPVKCWIYRQFNSSHGSQNLAEAIQHSCNPYFNTLANVIGKDALVEGFTMMNIGRRTGIELPFESPGMLPGSRTWRNALPTEVMNPHTIAMLSIGQGSTLATPLQVCAITACVANGGKYYTPRVVKQVVSENGKVIVPDVPKLHVDLIKSGVKPEDLELIRKGMRLSTNERGGTSGKAKLPKVIVASKSGTAQCTDDGKPSNNSWIMSFAPYENPKYAVCILVQNGGSGGGVCGPLVNLVLRGLFARDNGVRLPLRRMEKIPGNTDRIETTIEIPADLIASVEAGEMPPLGPGAALAVSKPAPDAAATEEGETGDETGEPAVEPLPIEDVRPIMPPPTITPEVDDEGTVIPRATPVPEP